MMPAHSSGAQLRVRVPVGQADRRKLPARWRIRRTRRRRPSRCSATPGTGSPGRARRTGTTRRCGAARRRRPGPRPRTRRTAGPRSTTSPTTSWPGITPRRCDRQVPLGDVQVGAAHPGRDHPYQQFVGGRIGHDGADQLERPGRHRTRPGDRPCPRVARHDARIHAIGALPGGLVVGVGRWRWRLLAHGLRAERVPAATPNGGIRIPCPADRHWATAWTLTTPRIVPEW